jgi:hypothetical protein
VLILAKSISGPEKLAVLAASIPGHRALAEEGPDHVFLEDLTV